SPWATYKKIYKQILGDGDLVLVAEKRGISGDVVDIRRFLELSTEQIKMLQSIQHPNIVTVHEIYSDKTNHHIVYEHMPRSLQEAVGNPYLNRQRLAAIVGQVVEALVYLEKMGLQHGHLSCSCILLHPSGRIKLNGQENCRLLSSKKDVVDLGYMMVELMQGYAKEGVNLGLDDPEHWDSDVVGFLSATTSASSANELSQHSFLRSWHKEKLKGLISLVMTWTRQDYEY
ncbi:kinase-like domain-containing protein, partial [Colletotrichum cereale]